MNPDMESGFRSGLAHAAMSVFESMAVVDQLALMVMQYESMNELAQAAFQNSLLELRKSSLN